MRLPLLTVQLLAKLFGILTACMYEKVRRRETGVRVDALAEASSNPVGPAHLSVDKLYIGVPKAAANQLEKLDMPLKLNVYFRYPAFGTNVAPITAACCNR